MIEGIQLRRYQRDDVDAVYEAVIASRAELARWMPWCHADYSRGDAVWWVESRPAAWERNEEWSHLIVDGRGGCWQLWDSSPGPPQRSRGARLLVRTSATGQGVRHGSHDPAVRVGLSRAGTAPD